MIRLSLLWVLLGAQAPAGMEALRDVEDLPRMHAGVRAFQSSSHDRGGGNYDSGNFLAARGGEHIMMEAEGPGEITRLWLTNAAPEHRVRIRLDGAEKPEIDLTVTELFSGAVHPFLWPLVGNDSVSSGGYYCYVPIPFRRSCRVTTDCKDLYYNVQYRLFDEGADLPAYDPCVDVSPALAAWSKLGEPEGSKRVEEKIDLPAGAGARVFEAKGGGRIVALRIRVSDPGGAQRALSILRGLRLRICWDGEAEPAVDAPIGPFHCVWFPESVAKGLFVGSLKTGEFYCYYPMPFADGARVELGNATGENIPVTVRVDWRPSAEDAAGIRAGALGRFRTVFRERRLRSGDPDYVFADLEGRGIALGVTTLMIGGPNMGQVFLEGDERIFYDGAKKPQLHGTGSEDFFNGGYYYERGFFTLPLHGYNGRRYETRDQEAMYRLFLADRIFYEDGFRAGMEHGGTNDQEGDYASVFYHYSAAPAEPDAPRRMPRAAETPAPVSIAGRVALPGGEPVAGARVEAGGASAITAPDGRYRIRGLAPGVYDVRVESVRTVPFTVYDVAVKQGEEAGADATVKSSCADLVVNGDFSRGFENGVARGWTVFHAGNYRGAFSDGGEAGQLIRTPRAKEGDCYAGLQQAVRVIPGQLYTFRGECRTRYAGEEENTWDNVMGKLCVHPLGRDDFRSKDVDFVEFRTEHDVWHRVERKFAVVADRATLYLAAWRKFPHGVDEADAAFRRVSFTGPTAPPPAPGITKAALEGGELALEWEEREDAPESWYSVATSRNERDAIVPWTRAGTGGTARLKDARVKRGCWTLVRCVNRLGVESGISVRRIE